MSNVERASDAQQMYLESLSDGALLDLLVERFRGSDAADEQVLAAVASQAEITCAGDSPEFRAQLVGRVAAHLGVTR